MSNSATVFFGLQPTRTTDVPDDVKAKGLSLCRAEPAKLHISGGATTIQPGYSLYVNYLPAFIAAAFNEGPYTVRDPFSVIANFNGTMPVLPFKLPGLVISWAFTVPEEVRDNLREKGFMDAMMKGKTAMIHPEPTISIVRGALETKCSETSPSNRNTVNIHDFRRIIVLIRTLSVFLRVHQYPAFQDDDHQAEFDKFQIDTKAKENSAMVVDDGAADKDEEEPEKPTLPLKIFRVNLPVDPESAPITFTDHTVPDYSGLTFPFVPELCKPDRTTVVTLIQRYFFKGLGDDETEAQEEYEQILSAWGNIVGTDFGDEFTHFCKVVEIALLTQTMICPIFTGNTYEGCAMMGSGYRIRIGAEDLEAQPKAILKPALRKMDWHYNALVEIMGRLSFLTDADRQAATMKLKKMSDLKHLFDTLTLDGGEVSRTKVREMARFLRFPGDSSFEVTAFNISAVLDVIGDPTKTYANIPISHISLLSSDRVLNCLSAFGETAPSFRVPGGKTMSLERPFEIAERDNGGKIKGSRVVKKLGCLIVPVEMAAAHYKEVTKDHCVLNPFGNAKVQNSASHINKVFEGESCSLILESLRRSMKVTVTTASGSKRKERDEEQLGPRKKGRAADIF